MTTQTATALEPLPAQSFPTVPIKQTCHQCGADLSHTHPKDEQRRISELETQVKILTGKATAAVDKLADYEDELRQLKTPTESTHPKINSPSRPSSATDQHRPASATGQHIASRLSHLLPTSSIRRASSQPPSSSQPTHNPTNSNATTHHRTPSPPSQPNTTQNPTQPQQSSTELLTLLTREQSLRVAAETRVSQTNEELEELSAQLFSEANAMVAAERKARAKLEEKVAVLEEREKEKRGRLEILEGRVARVERVRGLLARPGEGS